MIATEKNSAMSIQTNLLDAHDEQDSRTTVATISPIVARKVLHGAVARTGTSGVCRSPCGIHRRITPFTS
jgi:hypothetical protein